MYGAIIGDIAGSRFEFKSTKSKEFPFITQKCFFTDDTVMTIAVAEALLATYGSNPSANLDSFQDALIGKMRAFGQLYPSAGYGGRFDAWIWSDMPEPYNSYGNGSAMRVSPCGLIANSLDVALALAKASAEVTHNHPEGIKGAQATAAAIFLAKTGKNRKEIREYIEEDFYKLPSSVNDVRPAYSFDVTCQGSVPESILCFLESHSYEDAVRNAISLGGDADTQGAIAGSIAWAYYRFGCGRSESSIQVWPQFCEDMVAGYHINDILPDEFISTIDRFDRECTLRTVSVVGSQ